MFYARLIAAVATAAMATASQAYEIKARQSVHEAITRLAIQCLSSRPASPPKDCNADYTRIASIAGYPRSLLTNFNRLETAPRWSDDPTRDLYSPGGFIKFLRQTWLEGCEKGGTAQTDLESPVGRGIICGSHYGRLQFFHAMAARDEEMKPELTRRKVLDWAMFSYNVATGRVPIHQDYCPYVRSTPALESLAGNLAPVGFPYCKDGDRSHWSVGTLFSLKCWLPTGVIGCTEKVTDNRVRRAAAGALIHAIQDSYSQSHVARGSVPPNSQFFPRADCGFPTAFYAYTDANREHHSDADKPPAKGESCGQDGAALDVVTATAGAIWHLCRNSDPADVYTFLAGRVYGSPDGERRASAASPADTPGSPAPFRKRCASLI